MLVPSRTIGSVGTGVGYNNNHVNTTYTIINSSSIKLEYTWLDVPCTDHLLINIVRTHCWYIPIKEITAQIIDNVTVASPGVSPVKISGKAYDGMVK